MLRLFMTTALTVTVATQGSAQSAADDPMRDLTAGILAAIGKPAPVAAAPDTGASLELLVQQALSEGQSDAYLDALINEAVNDGRIAVADEMRDTDGDVDTVTLLASLVQKSSIASAPEAIVAEATGTAPATPAEPRYYTVQAGDSLAGISLIFYETTRDYTRIFEANRDQIRSPDRIQIGQTLLIPA